MPTQSQPSRVGILTGPTATGKTALAIELASRVGDLEIVNADSLLVYRGMDIGTAKPSAEERARVPHHLIDVRDPDQPFTAADFRTEALRVLDQIESRGRRALIVGGSGFYLKALLYGLWDAPKAEPELRKRLESTDSKDLYRELYAVDEEAALRIGGNDRYRLVRAVEILRLTGKTPSQLEAERPAHPDPRFRLWVIDRPPAELEKRIEARADAMLRDGLIDETRELLARFPESHALGAVGYAETVAWLSGEPPAGRKIAVGEAGLRAEILLATRQLVKRQRTWFRGERASRWFILDLERDPLDEEFREIYG